LQFAITSLTSGAINALRQDFETAILLGAGLLASYLVFLRSVQHSRAGSDRLAGETPSANCDGDQPRPESVEQAADETFGLRTARRHGGLRAGLRIFGLLGAFPVALLLGIEFFATPTLLQRAFQAIQAQSGIELTFETAEGGFLRGELILRNVKIRRQHHPKSNFDLACSEVRLGCSCWTLLQRDPVIEELLLIEVSGKYEARGPAILPNVARNPDAPAPAPPAPDLVMPEKRSIISIDHLRIVNSRILFTDLQTDGGRVEIDLTLKTLDCPAFRSDRAAFDICFRSNVEGLLNGQEFHVFSTNTPEGFKTEWSGKNLPVELARAYLDGPFRWLTQGTFDVHAVQLVRPDQTQPVQVTCRMVLTDVQAGVPDGLRPAVAIGAQFLVNYLNQQAKPLDLSFQVELNPNRFDLRTVESLDHFWSQVRKAAISSLLKAGGKKLGVAAEFAGPENADQASDVLSDLAERALERIKERRKAKREAKAKARMEGSPR
ncbi:MAG: hypothetical protein JWM11_261, partial [Planctomycetaceae bacterium]|nr:hypothetical protein [Planctomycetaceae bacterium]